MKARVGIAQIGSMLGDVKANSETHMSLLRSFNTQDVDFVCFPELSLTGYSLKDLAYEVPLRCMDAVDNIASITVSGKRAIFGYVREQRRGIIENSAAIVGDGKFIGSVAKFYLPTYGLFEENRYFSPAITSDIKIFQSPKCNFGVVICEDAWHQEPIEILARMGADMVFCLASSPSRGVHQADTENEISIERQWISLLKAHALMNTVFLVFVNRAGAEDEEYFWGGSVIVSPDGEIAGRAKKYEQDVSVFEIDLEDVGRARRFSSFRDHRTELHGVLEKL